MRVYNALFGSMIYMICSLNELLLIPSLLLDVMYNSKLVLNPQYHMTRLPLKAWLATSNVTGCNRGPSESFGLVRVPSLQRTSYFSSSSVVSCAFSALCVYLKPRHHPHLLGYLCVKFCFFHVLHCRASPWIEIACSITHSVTHPAYSMSLEPKQQKTSVCQKF